MHLHNKSDNPVLCYFTFTSRCLAAVSISSFLVINAPQCHQVFCLIISLFKSQPFHNEFKKTCDGALKAQENLLRCNQFNLPTLSVIRSLYCLNPIYSIGEALQTTEPGGCHKKKELFRALCRTEKCVFSSDCSVAPVCTSAVTITPLRCQENAKAPCVSGWV